MLGPIPRVTGSGGLLETGEFAFQTLLPRDAIVLDSVSRDIKGPCNEGTGGTGFMGVVLVLGGWFLRIKKKF